MSVIQSGSVQQSESSLWTWQVFVRAHRSSDSRQFSVFHHRTGSHGAVPSSSPRRFCLLCQQCCYSVHHLRGSLDVPQQCLLFFAILFYADTWLEQLRANADVCSTFRTFSQTVLVWSAVEFWGSLHVTPDLLHCKDQLCSLWKHVCLHARTLVCSTSHEAAMFSILLP